MTDTPPPTGSVKEAVDFLRKWSAEGPWVLSAIAPDKPGLEGETFTVDTLGKMKSWIGARLATHNIYFTVNPLLRAMSGNAKAKKTDVRGLAWLHVDVDPRRGETFESERERGLRVLREFKPPPTVIVDSGGGYQGFWKLKEEIRFDGDETRATELEAYSLQIEILLGADACHNIDRIMRLPGTVNWPNAKKREKGRVPAPAKVVEAEWDRDYLVTAFTAAQRVQAKSGGGVGSNGPEVRISGNLPKLGSLDELPEGVSQRVKMLIVQGDDPDDPMRYGSRSETVFAVACEMVRAGCSDDQIAAVLLDKDFGISSHIYDQSRPQNYAARQIKRARDNAVHPKLQELNEKHAVIEDIGGKCRVVSEIMDETLKRGRISFQSFDDVRNRYMNQKVPIGENAEGKTVYMPLGKWWLGHPERRQYKSVAFAPGREAPGYYNLWKGFAYEVRPGDCSKYLKHLFENICSKNEAYYEYLLDWMARAVQFPDTPGGVAIVIRGRQGTGKGFFAKTFGALWGRHFLQVSDPKHLVGSFNYHLRDCVVLFGDEAFFSGDHRHVSILKTLITEENIIIEGKGLDAVSMNNYVHLIMSSNSDWVIPADQDERRYLVLDMGEEKKQNNKYFAEIQKELDNGGYPALLHTLLTRDISKFDHRAVPKTAALQNQKVLSLDPKDEWWLEILKNGRVFHGDSEWRTEVNREDLQREFLKYMEDHKHNRRASATVLGIFLGKRMAKPYPVSFQQVIEVPKDSPQGGFEMKRKRAYFYTFPTLEECRAKWDEEFGATESWITEVKPSSEETWKAPF